jgi:diketogulonate reductase-like aldo/keto reductase
VEYHPFIDQSEVLAACRAHGLSLTAYSPLAKGRVFGDPVIEEVARRHGRTAGQVAIRWLVQQPDVIAIPRSSKPEHARANLDVMDFALSEDDMDRISRLGTRQGRLVNPAWSPRWD